MEDDNSSNTGSSNTEPDGHISDSNTEQPADYNQNIFEVFFYFHSEDGYDSSLGDYGRFNEAVPDLDIRKSTVLLKIGKQDIRGMRKTEFQQYLETNEGMLVHWTLISIPYDNNLLFNPGIKVLM